METTRPNNNTRQAVAPVALLVLLTLAAVSMALLALVAPDVNIELPVTPEFTFSPPSPHLQP